MHEYEIYEAITSTCNRTVRMDRERDSSTKEEKEQLVKLFCQGEGITAIVIRLQRTDPAIMQQIEKMNLYRHKEAPTRSNSGLPLVYATTASLIQPPAPSAELVSNLWRMNNV